ncbi:MAG TPA: hypothetical protein VG796_07115 [Verrucomicrobiales bacterium]|nr:hypothetical protein [Verrucomicrobiales bacterium]
MKPKSVPPPPATAPANTEYWSRIQTSAFAQVSIPTLKRYESSGLLQGHRFGLKLVRYRADDIRALFAPKPSVAAPATGNPNTSCNE